MQNLGITIQKLRKEKRLSQTELAHLLNIPAQSKISAWENGTCVPDVFGGTKISSNIWRFFGVSFR